MDTPSIIDSWHRDTTIIYIYIFIYIFLDRTVHNRAITRKPRTTLPERYSVALAPALSAVSTESTRKTSIGLHHIPLEHQTEDWN